MVVFDLEKAVEWWDRPGWRRLRRRTGERSIKERGVRRQQGSGIKRGLFIYLLLRWEKQQHLDRWIQWREKSLMLEKEECS